MRFPDPPTQATIAEPCPLVCVSNNRLVTNHHIVAAGPFSHWLDSTRTAHRERSGVEVACGECIACCTSSQFIHIEPDEIETLARIPAELLYEAPGLPQGHLLMGYDEDGHCPMLVEGRCSVYDSRPRTCRTYDCRVFAATGVSLSGSAKAAIAERVEQWEFSYSTNEDSVTQAAVKASAAFLVERVGQFESVAIPEDPTPLAVLALAIHDVFIERITDSSEAQLVSPTVADVEARVAGVRNGSG